MMQFPGAFQGMQGMHHQGSSFGGHQFGSSFGGQFGSFGQPHNLHYSERSANAPALQPTFPVAQTPETRLKALEECMSEMKEQVQELTDSMKAIKKSIPVIKGRGVKSASVNLRSGRKMPALGLGTWKAGPGEVAAALKAAVEEGYRHIDCAAVYGNEKEIGAALKEIFEEGKVKRSDLFIVSKLWNSFHEPEVVQEACDQTLSDLGLEYLDLYLMHWPTAFKHDGANKFPKDDDGKMIYSFTHWLETWAAMEKLATAGKVRALGVSNFSPKQLTELLSNKQFIKPSVLQVECHPFLNQTALLEICRANDMVMTAYSPLGSNDRPWKKDSDPMLLEDELVKELAEKYDRSMAQILIRFLIQRGITVIPKSAKAKRIKENSEVFDFELEEYDMDRLMNQETNFRFCLPCVEVDGKPTPRDMAHPFFPFAEDLGNF